MSARVPAVETTVTHDCGFTKTSRTAGIAAKALRDHSCEFQHVLKARAQRVAERKASSGTRRDCQCKTVHHEHGTLKAYKIDGCHCRPCRDANSADKLTSNRQKAYGTFDRARVPAQPVRDHINLLIAAGISDRTISDAAGVSRTTIRAIMRGRNERGGQINKSTTKAVAAAILALKPSTEILGDGCFTDATGTRRRIQALATIGWPQSRIAARIGIRPSNMVTLLRQDRVTVRMAKTVRAVYDQLWDQQPATTTSYEAGAVRRSKTLSARKGWVPPMAWDDDTIDDPNTMPDLGGKQLKKDTVADDVAFMHSTGSSRDEIAARLGQGNWKTVEKQLYRVGRHDLVTMVKTDVRDNARHARKGHAA